MVAAACDQPNDVLLHLAVNRDRGDGIPRLADLILPSDLTKIAQWIGILEAVEHLNLGAGGQIPKADPEAETVELSLRQWKSAGELHRVLRRQDHEGRVQWVGDAVESDLPLLHRLQQRRLGLGGGTVDLVSQQHVGEDRSGPE